MTDRENIALQLTLKALEKTSFNSKDDVKDDPTDIFNSIYKNLDDRI